MAKHTGTNNDFLAMALIGYEAHIAKINAALAEIQARLGHRGVRRPTVTKDVTAPAKRTMSAAGRRHIAAAQRKRWAAARKGQAQAQGKSAAKPGAPKKRRMSAAARKKIGDATRKRWAAQRRAAGQKGAIASA